MKKVVFTILIGVLLLASAPKVEAASSPYTPFGGRVEEYISKSEAQCVKNTCGKINEPVHKAIKEAVAGPVATLCTGVSAACTFIPVLGNIACFAACVATINEAIEDSVSICNIEEIRVGPPVPASLGILNIGTLDIDIGFRVPPLVGPRIRIARFKLSLSKLLPGVSDITPEPKIYAYGEYRTEGNWVLGDSLNLSKLCGLGGGGSSFVCNNVIVKALLGGLSGGQKEVGNEAYNGALGGGASETAAQAARKKAELEYAASCPLLNLLHQVGTSK